MANQEKRPLRTARPLKQKDKKTSMEMHQMDIQRALSISLAAIDDLRDGLSLCLEASLQISGMDCGGVFLFDEKNGNLNLTVHKGLNKDLVNKLSKFGKFSETAILVKKGPPLYTLVEKLPMPLTQDQQHGRLRAFAVVPLFAKSNVIGCFAVSSTSFDEITMSSRIALETIVAQAGNAIARLQANKKLHESEKHLRSLMLTADYFAIYRLIISDTKPNNLGVVFVSPSIKEIMGVSEPMKFETWFENIHEDDRERIIKANLESFQTNRFDEIMKINHPDKKEPRWIHAISNGITSQNGEIQYINGLLIDITERKRVEEALVEKDAELQAKSSKLEEINIALKILLQQRETDKSILYEQVLSNVNKLIVPYIGNLKKGRLDNNQKAFIEVIEKNLKEITSSQSYGLSSQHFDLTRKELIVADLIKQGKKTKEIATMLELAPKTIEVHRNSIRNKLGLKNIKRNLTTYLRSLSYD